MVIRGIWVNYRPLWRFLRAVGGVLDGGGVKLINLYLKGRGNTVEGIRRRRSLGFFDKVDVSPVEFAHLR